MDFSSQLRGKSVSDMRTMIFSLHLVELALGRLAGDLRLPCVRIHGAGVGA